MHCIWNMNKAQNQNVFPTFHSHTFYSEMMLYLEEETEVNWYQLENVKSVRKSQ